MSKHISLESDGHSIIHLDSILLKKNIPSHAKCDHGLVEIKDNILYWHNNNTKIDNAKLEVFIETSLALNIDLEIVIDVASNVTTPVKYSIANYLSSAKLEVINNLYKTNSSSLEEAMTLLKNNFESRTASKYVVLNKVSSYVNKHKKVYYYPGYIDYHFEIPVSWGENESPFDKRSWKYGFNSWVFMDSLLETFSVENLRFAIDIALDWFEYNVVKTHKNSFAWYDMSVAFRATRIPYLIEHGLRNEVLSIDEFYKLSYLLKLHILDLIDDRKLAKHSNHGLYQLAGLLAIANTLPELRQSTLIINYASNNLLDILNKDVNSEGLHLEHSPAYHIYITEIMSAISKAGWLDNVVFNEKVLLMSNNTCLLSHPNGKIVRFGDTSERLTKQVFKYNENKYVKYVASEGKDGSNPTNISNIFPDSGYALFRSPWKHSDFKSASFLAFSAAFHKRTHKHADDFNFEWSELGSRILVDAGMFGYERDAPEREYVQSTRAHNCVEIDETDYSRYNLDIYGSAITAWSDGNNCKIVEAYINRKRFFKTQHRRILFYKPGEWLIVVDHLKSPDRHKYTQWFHLDPELTLTNDESNLKTFLNEDNFIHIQQLSENSQLEHIIGQTEPRLQGWTSVESYKLTPNDTIGFTVNGSEEHTFATLFTINKSECSPQKLLFKSSSNGKYIRIKWRELDNKCVDLTYRISKKERTLDINGINIPINLREHS